MIFSDPINRTGIVQLLEDFTNTQSDTVNSVSYSLARKTRDINNAYINYTRIAAASSGKQQVDDVNHEKYPIVYLDLVSGQDNYHVDNDGENVPNQIQEIYSLRIKAPNGQYIDLTQIDKSTENINTYQGMSGVPEKFDLIGNGIIFYPTPNYDSSEGIELYVQRSPSYFTTSDTTKKPGIPEVFHEYLAIRPAYFWCIWNLPSLAANYEREMLRIEESIKKYYSRRNKTFRDVITSTEINPI